MAQLTETTARPAAAPADALSSFERQRRIKSPWRIIVRRLVANRMSMVGLFLIVFILLGFLLAPVIAAVEPIDMPLEDKFIESSGSHLLGTDDFGRDILSR